MEKWQGRSEDAWLYRDGVSMLLVRHHIDAGLEVPDRWDFDFATPQSKDQPKFAANFAWGG